VSDLDAHLALLKKSGAFQDWRTIEKHRLANLHSRLRDQARTRMAAGIELHGGSYFNLNRKPLGTRRYLSKDWSRKCSA
jgi:hypothetical protein